jgi:2-(1,2-epoxy-1,2-dihydrophenyl)acetyl-CoA isomerase
MGIANQCVPHQELLPRALRWCDQLAEVPAHALAMAKPLLRAAADIGWEQAIVMEEFAEPMCFTTRAHRERVAEMLHGSGPR